MREILKVTVGSIAHGTNTPESDLDVRRVFVEPTSVIVGIGNYQKTMANPGEDDNSWELAHFCYLALRNNPQSLEVLLARYDEATEWGLQLRELFPCFLKRKNVYAAFLGFATSQKKKVLSESTPSTRRSKCAAHYIRTLWNGFELLSTGTFTVRIADVKERNVGATVLSLKKGELDPAHALELGTEIEALYDQVYNDSVIPLESDKVKINDYLVNVRRQYFD